MVGYAESGRTRLAQLRGSSSGAHSVVPGWVKQTDATAAGAVVNLVTFIVVVVVVVAVGGVPPLVGVGLAPFGDMLKLGLDSFLLEVITVEGFT